MSIEEIIKGQYSKFFKENNWSTFKLVADYYFRKAATIKNKDLENN